MKRNIRHCEEAFKPTRQSRFIKALWIASLALAMTSSISKAQVISMEGFCKNLPAYQQEEGVEFTPNTDDVVPADLNAIKTPVLDPIEIPVLIDVNQRFNLNLPADIITEPQAAIIKVHSDGRVEYNGQDITHEAYAACGEEAADKPETADGQTAEDTVKSEPETEASKKVETQDPPEDEIIEGQYP